MTAREKQIAHEKKCRPCRKASALLNPPIYFINVNRHTVTANRRAGAWKVGAWADPPIRIAKGRYGRPRYAYEIRLTGLVTMKYDPTNPLPCGASAWLEASGVEVLR